MSKISFYANNGTSAQFIMPGVIITSYNGEHANFSLVWDSDIYGQSAPAQSVVSLYISDRYIGDVTFAGITEYNGVVITGDIVNQILGSDAYVLGGSDPGGNVSDNIYAKRLISGFNFNVEIYYEDTGHTSIWPGRGTLTDFADNIFEYGEYLNLNVIPFVGTFQKDNNIFVVQQDQYNTIVLAMVENPRTFAPPNIPTLNYNPFIVPSAQPTQFEAPEGGRAMTTPLEYIASYVDLRAAFGADAAMGRTHFLEHGLAEGRSASFRGLDYIASYPDLIAAFGADSEAGERHYVAYGVKEGRLPDTFDGARYLANYADLRAAFGTDTNAAAAHFITFGHAEGRTDEVWA